MFFMFYVHDSIVFITNCFITVLQHVRGQSALCCQINANANALPPSNIFCDWVDLSVSK